MEYYSYTLFHKNIPVISTCNNDEWLGLYSQKFDPNHTPPVQKYILSSGLSVIMWDFFEIDEDARDFINLRNQIVGVRNNITILSRNKNTVKCFTFGTKLDSDHLLNFVISGAFKKYL